MSATVLHPDPIRVSEEAMKVIDFFGVQDVSSLDELRALLRRRSNAGCNAFWLSHGNAPYPTLSLLVKGDLATLNYIPRESDAGFRSLCSKHCARADATMTFATSETPADDIAVLNDAVVPLDAALEAANQFFLQNSLPKSVEWLRL